jgi:RNA polymerase subunit RPABC4/transcription elongation factor Spt4
MNMKKKVCRSCKIFVEGHECPICKGGLFSENWNGRMTFFDVSKSLVAKNVGIHQKGEYVIKVK